MFNKPELPKIEKVEYSKIRKCVMKKEAGEHTEECREVFKKANISEE